MSRITIVTLSDQAHRLHSLANWLQDRGYSVQVVCVDSPGDPRVLADPNITHYLPFVTEESLQQPGFRRVLKRLQQKDARLIPLVSHTLADKYPFPNAIYSDRSPREIKQQILVALRPGPGKSSSGRKLAFVFASLATLLIIVGMVILFTQLGETDTSQVVAELPIRVVLPTNTAQPEPVVVAHVADFTMTPVDGPAPLTVEFSATSPLEGAHYLWDYGIDGATGTGENSIFTFERSGVFTVALTVTYNGVSKITTGTLIVRPGGTIVNTAETILLAEFSVSSNNGPAPLTVTFENESLGPVDAVEWDFDGNGDVDSTESDPEPYTYNEPGSYVASLTVYDSDGNQDTVSVDIEVEGEDDAEATPEAEPTVVPILAAFDVSQKTGVAPVSIAFTNRSTGTELRYSWDFNGDGITDSEAESPPPYMYQTPGRFEATLAVVDANGRVSRASETIAVLFSDNFDAIEPQFSVFPARGPAPLLVRFENQSIGEIASFAWDFDGNGVVDSFAPNPGSFSYAKAGIYDASLVITSAGGNQKATALSVIVEPPGLNDNITLFADFVASATSGIAPLTVQFVNQSSGSVTGVEWDLNGDGIFDDTTFGTTTFTYNTPGSYEAQLTIYGIDGDVATATVLIEVEDAESALFADYFATPLSGLAPLTVRFLNYAYGDIVSYQWDFDGDGTADSIEEDPPPYTYDLPGSYDSTLTVFSSNGQAQQSSIRITVFDQLRASFEVSPISGPAPLTVMLTNTSVGDIAATEWDFDGDGLVDSAEESPAPITFETAGVFVIALTVYDSTGNQDRYEQFITVHEATATTPTAESSATATASSTPETTLELTPEVTDEVSITATQPTPEVTVEVTVDVTPSPETTPEVTPEVTVEPTATPIPEPTTTNTPETTPELTLEVTPEPTDTSTSVPPTNTPTTTATATAEVTVEAATATSTP